VVVEKLEQELSKKVLRSIYVFSGEETYLLEQIVNKIKKYFGALQEGINYCYLDETNVDAVMIGRGVLGNPWLIKECVDYLNDGTEPQEVSFIDKVQMMRKHYELLTQDKNEKLALLEIRSHIIWYLKGMPQSKEIKNKICQSKTTEDMFNIIDEYYNYLLNEKED